jgi:hypothetical protein
MFCHRPSSPKNSFATPVVAQENVQVPKTQVTSELNRWGFGARAAPRPNNSAKSGADPIAIGNTHGICARKAIKTSRGGRTSHTAKIHPARNGRNSKSND